MNLKKVLVLGILTTTTMLFSTSLTSNVVRGENNELFKLVSLATIYKHKDILEKDLKKNTTMWYLRRFKPIETKKLESDEFAFQDFYEENEKELINLSKSYYEQLKDTELTLTSVTELGEYNFTTEKFPISVGSENTYFDFGVISNNSTYNSELDLSIDSYIYTSDLFFTGFNKEIEVLPMEKSIARTFIKKRRTNNGVDRRVVIKYNFTLVNYDNKGLIEMLKGKCNKEDNYSYCPAYSVKITGKLKNIDIYDLDRTTLLHSINY